MEEQDDRPQDAPGPVPESGSARDPSAANLSFRTSGGRNDGSAELSISDDGMSAQATFYPPMGEGLPITREYVSGLMDRLGVTSGILWDQIDEALLKVNLDRHVLRAVIVAQGAPPITEIPEHAELDPKFRPSGPHIDTETQRVDFRELGNVHVVKAGEVIARLIPRVAGMPGTDVYGRSIPCGRSPVASVTPGSRVERRGDELVSAVDGRLTINADRLDVDEVLIVKGAVDFSTGHIVFPGDVVIEGVVRDGFKVWSGGTILCKSTMDAFDVNAKKDLICTQGIIGRRRAQIRVGGELRAKFIQNCRAAARGDVHVSGAVVNCRLYSLGRVDLGDKGVFMGGEIYAVHGLRCGRLGNQAHQRTMVHVGTDFTVQQRLDQANERLRLLSQRSRQVESLAHSHPGGGAEQVRADIAKASAEQTALISSLLGQLDADDSAVVEIRMEVFPGVVIEICRISIVIEEHLKACRLHLDKAAGRIVVEH